MIDPSDFLAVLAPGLLLAGLVALAGGVLALADRNGPLWLGCYGVLVGALYLGGAAVGLARLAEVLW